MIKDKNVTKTVVNGWRAMQSGTPIEKKVMNESVAPSENNFKPGQDEEPNQEVSYKRMKEHVAKMLQKKVSQKEFKGSAELCCLQLEALYESGKKVQIVNFERSGFAEYKLTFLSD